MFENLQKLERELCELIVMTLNLENVTPHSIDPSAPLFGTGLGLDSIDALEIGAVIKQKYGIKISSQSEGNRSHFESVSALAKFIMLARDKTVQI